MFKKLFYFISLVLVLSMAGNSSADLVVRWGLDEGSGTTAFDSSGNGNDGEFIGDPQWVDGHGGGGALQFDGDDDNVLYSLEEATAWPAFSITFWVKATTLGQDNYSSPFSGHFPNSAGFQIDVEGGDPGSYRVNPSGLLFGTASIDWVHLALIAEGTAAKLYYNGELTNEGTLNDSIINQFRLGQNRNDSNTFAGTVDDLRVYDHAISEVELLSAMTGKIFPYAFGPVPTDGVMYEETWVNLAWKPGGFAVSHDIYFGDNFDDVDSGAESAFQGNQAGTEFIVGFPGMPYPDGLVPGTTYYWRIDEVNDTDPNSPWKGNIWSFSIPPKTAYFPNPADGAEAVDPNGDLSWTPGFGAKLHHAYFGDNFDEVNNATGALPLGDATYDPGPLVMAKTYYWRIDEFDIIETHKGDVWSFTTEGAVGSPDPVKGAVDVTQTPVLTWVPGIFADTHEVYFGADAASLELKGSGNLGSESFESGQLEWNTTYYWRIDEANNSNADSPWTGPLWNFTTANFLIIDDMENYNDLDPAEPGSNRIFLAWIDGFDNPATNGSIVGYANPPFAEQSIVHSGLQSMPLAYDNAVGKSEATLTLTSNRDWTVNGVNTLTIWYRGGSANAAETMFVVLNGTAGVDNDNPNAAQATSWTEWNIDLTRFTDQGVNLTNVTSITLGLGNRTNPTAGGSGMMYFDDIRLYPPAP
ncbi:MAG: LamG domain-containing protein [Planctomycetes bacterium]|nr:LamG domain-containing protein [Planctomycetota bacterium]